MFLIPGISVDFVADTFLKKKNIEQKLGVWKSL